MYGKLKTGLYVMKNWQTRGLRNGIRQLGYFVISFASLLNRDG